MESRGWTIARIVGIVVCLIGLGILAATYAASAAATASPVPATPSPIPVTVAEFSWAWVPIVFGAVTGLFTCVAAGFAAYRSIVNGKQIDTVHAVVNSRTDDMLKIIAAQTSQIMKLTGNVGYATGILSQVKDPVVAATLRDAFSGSEAEPVTPALVPGETVKAPPLSAEVAGKTGTTKIGSVEIPAQTIDVQPPH